MAHVKGTGTTSLGRDSRGQRLGLKLSGGQLAKSGSIIVKQKGTKYRPGRNVKIGKDDTIFATINGKVAFTKKKVRRFNGALKKCVYISVIPV